MNYSFFDYKHNIVGFESDLFSPTHIAAIVVVYILAILIPVLLRKAKVKEKQLTWFIRILGILVAVLEITKVTWESVWDVRTGQGFNFGGILPLYTCSLYIYCMLLAGFTKGKVRQFALAFLTTISLLYGAIGVVYCNGLNFYPFWTFGGLHSFFFHTSMFMTGMILLITGYYKLEWKDVLRAFVPLCVLAIFAIPVDYKLGVDYMLVYSAGSVPLYEDLASNLAAKGLRPVFTAIMMLTHLPLAALIVGLYKLGVLIFKKTEKAAEA